MVEDFPGKEAFDAIMAGKKKSKNQKKEAVEVFTKGRELTIENIHDIRKRGIEVVLSVVKLYNGKWFLLNSLA